MERIRQRLIRIHSCPSLPRRVITEAYEIDPTFKRVEQMSKKELVSTFSLTSHMAHTLRTHLQRTKTFDALYPSTIYGIPVKVKTLLDDDYPERLKHIPDPPWVLYGLGDWTIASKEKVLAVVGSRHPTSYGQQTLAKWIPALTKADIVIVSGMAIGIDTISHQQAITHSGKTIAVLGSGLAHLYPPSNQALAIHIASHHLLLTEYPPHTPPRKWQFPERNRIISGLSDVVFIVEAKHRSGSLITADQALEQGRQVFALPGSVHSPFSKGTNAFIQQGAEPALSPDDIIRFWE